MSARAMGAAAALAAGLVLAGAAAEAQTCNYLSKAAGQAALAYLSEGTVVQAYCAPCRDRIARKIVVEEAELRVADSYYVQVLINGDPVDPAYLYVFEPRRARWRNLGLLIACHEEDDVPPTLPPSKFVP